VPSLSDTLIPGKLLLRALDDLHTIARSADRGVAKLDDLDRRGARIEELGERFLAVGERLDARGAEILEFGTSFEQLGRELHTQARVMDEHARQVEAVGAEIVAALPTLEQAVTIVSPLEGAVERIGRAVDRLPGGARRVPDATDHDALEEGEQAEPGR